MTCNAERPYLPFGFAIGARVFIQGRGHGVVISRMRGAGGWLGYRIRMDDGGEDGALDGALLPSLAPLPTWVDPPCDTEGSAA